MDKNNLFDIISRAGLDSQTSKTLTDFISKMQESDIDKINDILNDKSKSKAILESESAKKIIDELGQGK